MSLSQGARVPVQRHESQQSRNKWVMQFSAKRPLSQNLMVLYSPAAHRPSGLNCSFQESDALFLQYLKHLGCLPDELLAISELLDMVLLILRVDFELLYSQYRLNQLSSLCDCKPR